MASCVSCHAGIAKHKVVHSAISKIGCEACHEVSRKGEQWDVKLVANGNDLCFGCHADKKPPAPGAKVRTHFPIAEGECEACHDPHGSEYDFLLPGSTDGTGEDNFCFTCHFDIADLTKKTTVHGILEVGGCLVCHQTHKSGDPSKQEFAFHLEKSAPSLCLGCHDGTDKDLIATHHGQPFQKAVCTDCHNPHGSDAAKLIRPYAHPPFAGKMCDACHEEPKDGKVVLREEGKQALCFMCHVDKEKQISTAKFKHTLLDLVDTCTTCHSPHATDQPRWLQKPVRALCGDCHEDEASSPVVHKPLETAESCAICHDPHASDYPFHLRANIDDLCLTCHGYRPALKRENDKFIAFGTIALPGSLFQTLRRIPIRSASDRGHPFMRHPVSGKNTLVPAKGNLTCVSCHNPHGIKHGRKLLAIQGTNLCLSCHGKQKSAADKTSGTKQ